MRCVCRRGGRGRARREVSGSGRRYVLEYAGRERRVIISNQPCQPCSKFPLELSHCFALHLGPLPAERIHRYLGTHQRQKKARALGDPRPPECGVADAWGILELELPRVLGASFYRCMSELREERSTVADLCIAHFSIDVFALCSSFSESHYIGRPFLGPIDYERLALRRCPLHVPSSVTLCHYLRGRNVPLEEPCTRRRYGHVRNEGIRNESTQA